MKVFPKSLEFNKTKKTLLGFEAKCNSELIGV
jgi:hypothetical protein